MPSGDSERVFNYLKPRTPPQAAQCDHVEADIAFTRSSALYKKSRRALDLCALVRVYRLRSFAARAPAAGFYLDEHQGVAVQGDQVDLRPAGAVVARNDAVATSPKPAGSKLLAPRSKPNVTREGAARPLEAT